MKFFSIMLIAFLTVTATKGQSEFEDWDKNDDNKISRSEFTLTFIANYVDDWNTDDNEYLDDEDFYNFTYHKVWDKNADERLSVAEWNRGYDYYYGEYVLESYDDVDKDNDGYVSYSEYKAALRKTDFYQNFDMNNDNNLSDFELARGVFNMWDTDNSRFLEYDEFLEFDVNYEDL